jgi:hypothetical protein
MEQGEIFQIEYHCSDCGSITPIVPGIVACLGCNKPLLIVATTEPRQERTMFEKVRLITRDDGFVAEVIIPFFNPPAEVLIWGERCFVFQHEHHAGRRGIYREGMMWPVLPQEQYKGLDL